MKRLRISAISYLNTAPLMWDFEHGNAASQFDISYTLPSECARALEQGSADIGIIPAGAYASIPDLQILPGVAIASRRAVRSILVVSRVPINDVRTVALDTSSITSVALAKVLFEKWLGGGRTFFAAPPDLKKMLAVHDAALLIGDPALQVDRTSYFTLDLAEEWIRYTGKPFVFALWAVREDALRHADSSLDLAAVFQQSRDHGLRPESLKAIARDWAPRLHISATDAHTYLSENIYYHLDDECMEGLRLFYRYAAEVGALLQAPELSFVDAGKAAIS